MHLEADHVYLMPPRHEMAVSDGQIRLTERDPGKGLVLPIDVFFRSLAEDAGAHASLNGGRFQQRAHRIAQPQQERLPRAVFGSQRRFAGGQNVLGGQLGSGLARPRPTPLPDVVASTPHARNVSRADVCNTR
jgi:hypothetical protein